MNWTGDVYVDVGLATILAFCNKVDPAQLNADDFNTVADWIADNYVRDPLKSFLTVAFTSNAWFAQPSFTPEKRKERGQLHLYGWQRPSETGERCVFTGLPVAANALSDKLMAGRAARAQIPLTQGDEDINFYPYGDSGLPISGEALLCLQAFPLGCAKVQGRLLAVHASQHDVTLGFAKAFLEINRKGVQLAQQAGETQLPESHYGKGTLLIDTLLKVLHEARFMRDASAPVSLTAYHLTNAREPKIDIHPLPLGVTSFLIKANTAQFAAQWQRIVSAAWQREPDEDGTKAAAKVGKPKTPATPKKPAVRRNYLYEDVLRLPDEAARFLRLYFLRHVPRQKRALEGDPRNSYSTRAEVSLVSWELTALFLKEVMTMDKTRIEHIRTLGDRLADYVAGENDRKFFTAFYSVNRYPLLRNALIKANLQAVRKGEKALITFDQYIEIFEEGEEIARKDWSLARDLVLIRMIERLADTWLKQNADAIPEQTTDEAEDASSD
jgi:CRISPR-associated protein Cst1